MRKGKKKYGRQNYPCMHCGRPCQDEYHYKGCEPLRRTLALRCLCRGIGVRDSNLISQLSKDSVLKLIKTKRERVVMKPKQPNYSQV